MTTIDEKVGNNQIKTIECPKCGAPNQAGSTLCLSCGSGFANIKKRADAKKEKSQSSIPLETKVASSSTQKTMQYMPSQKSQGIDPDMSGFIATLGLFAAFVYGILYIGGDHRTNKEYSFNGDIEGEHIVFEESFSGKKNYLAVTREDGTKLVFTDYDDDLRLEEVAITTCSDPSLGNLGCNKAVYSIESDNPSAKAVVEKNQAVFDSYLEKIMDLYISSAELTK